MVTMGYDNSQLMTKTEFSRLCQVSHPMMAPQKYGSLLIMKGKKVDAVASLAALEGHLDEAKRRAALAHLGQAAPPPASGDVIDFPTSHRARKEKADADMKELDLLERQGLLVPAAEVEVAIADAVQTYFAEVDRRKHQAADALSGKLNLTLEQAREVRAFFDEFTRNLRASYAKAMQVKAEASSPRRYRTNIDLEGV